jgi:hypothetical protein
MLQCRVFFTAAPSTSRRTLQANKKQETVTFLVILFSLTTNHPEEIFLICINVLAWLLVPGSQLVRVSTGEHARPLALLQLGFAILAPLYSLRFQW